MTNAAKLTREQFMMLVAKASRAPSAHNTQPAKFKLVDDDTIELSGDRSRILMTADSTWKDHFISLGAAAEGLRLACAELGWSCHMTVIADSKCSIDANKLLHPVARFKLMKSNEATDDLSKLVERRYCVRNSFSKREFTEFNNLSKSLTSNGPHLLISQPEKMRQLAELYDRATQEILCSRAQAQELYQWLRLSPFHTNRSPDGLTSACMGFSRFDTLLAIAVMHPLILPHLMKLPTRSIIINEKDRVASSSFLCAIFAPMGESLLETGARFYRTWLILTKYGLGASPLSSLVDHSPTEIKVNTLIKQDNPEFKEFRIINLWRCGYPNIGHTPRSNRLQVKELVYD